MRFPTHLRGHPSIEWCSQPEVPQGIEGNIFGEIPPGNTTATEDTFSCQEASVGSRPIDTLAPLSRLLDRRKVKSVAREDANHLAGARNVPQQEIPDIGDPGLQLSPQECRI